MKLTKVAVGVLACLLADVALAGTVLGAPLGITLGAVLGLTLGTALPIVGSLGVVAVALVVGIRIVRRKR
jgi:hypothetical protein